MLRYCNIIKLKWSAQWSEKYRSKKKYFSSHFYWFCGCVGEEKYWRINCWILKGSLMERCWFFQQIGYVWFCKSLEWDWCWLRRARCYIYSPDMNSNYSRNSEISGDVRSNSWTYHHHRYYYYRLTTSYRFKQKERKKIMGKGGKMEKICLIFKMNV